MKKNLFTRVFCLVLALVLLLPVLPRNADAAVVKTHGTVGGASTRSSSYGTVSGYWSDQRIRRNDRYTYPYEFYQTLVSCTGFTLDYEILEVQKGNLSGNFVFEVLVRLTSGTWKSVDTFYLKGDSKTINITFDNPMSIDAVMVVCQKKAELAFVHDLTVRNPTYKKSSTTTTAWNAVGGWWSDEELRRSNHISYPFELYSPISRCKSFTLNYEITEVTKGNLDGNFKYAVVVRTTAGNWKYVAEFKMKGYSTSTTIKLSSPVSFDAVAVYCLKNDRVDYSYNFTITNPVTK